MPLWLAPWTRICPEASTYRRRLPSPWREPSLTAWRMGKMDIFPDPMSESMAESWRSGAVKALERQFAALVEAEPIKA